MNALDTHSSNDVDEAPLDAASAIPLDRVSDIPIRVSAVLGRTRMSVADLASLKDGSIVELDRKVGEPIDLYVNDRLIARGELVMLDGVLGVTMTEIVRKHDL